MNISNREINRRFRQKSVKTQISMSYIFVLICMFGGKACSFICRSLAVLCTWMYFLSFVSAAITQTHWHGILNRRMQSPGRWHTGKVSHAEATMCDALMALGNEESTSYLLGVRTAHVRGGSRHFRWIDTIVDNFARCKTKISGACMYDWTCSSSSKPPAIAVHVLAETPRPASRPLVQRMSVVNKSANMPLI